MRFVTGTPRLGVALFAAAAVLTGAAGGLLGTCGPFTDTANDAFCPFVLEVFYLGITTGTTSTTYDPAANVTRLQMAAFLSRSVDRVLLRGSRRAALDQFWPNPIQAFTTVGPNPIGIKSDGTDVWVADGTDGTVRRVRGSDLMVLQTWTGATNARAVLPLAGKVFVSSADSPGHLYMIDPTQPPGAVITLATNLGNMARGAASDGRHGWTANNGSVSIIKAEATLPWTVTTVTTGFNSMAGPTFDGSNIWVTNINLGTLLKLDSNGGILQTVTLSAGPGFPIFDGTNLWVPATGALWVVRPGSGAVLATLTGNGLGDGLAAAFDGQRIAVTSADSAFVSLWKAADLTPLGNFDFGFLPNRICSDGLNFWMSLSSSGQIVRF